MAFVGRMQRNVNSTAGSVSMTNKPGSNQTSSECEDMEDKLKTLDETAEP